MNEQQYVQVCNACDRVLMAQDAKLETVAIPWLHVIREHPSFLKQYEGLFATSAPFLDHFKVITKKLTNKVSWICQLFRSFTFNGSEWEASQTLSEPVDVVFVSHLLKAADAGKPSDFYFGDLPEILHSVGKSVIVVLINHSESSDLSIVKSWDRNAVTRVLLSRTLNFQAELSLLRRLKKESLRLAKLSSTEAPGFQKRLFSSASCEAMSGSARDTLRMFEQVKQLVRKIQPKMMVATFEGHAWERVICSAAHEISPNLQFLSYQHAALFRLQHGALRMLGHPFDPDLVLTAGLVSEIQMLKSEGMQGVPVKVLGSHRAYLGQEGLMTRDGEKKQTSDCGELGFSSIDACLVLPEGIISECIQLFEFSLRCAELEPERLFIWRLHPLVTFRTLISGNSVFRDLPKNIELSTNTIEKDFERARFALYRGTTAIVQAVCCNVRPIYVALADEMTIDPLYQLCDWKWIVRRPEELTSLIAGDDDTKSLGKDIAIKYCRDFYTRIDPSVLISRL